MFVLLLAVMFLPHTVVHKYPQPDPDCLYEWTSDASVLENKCESPLVVDVAYKNGLGTHAVLRKGETLTMRPPPAKVFVCTEGQGVPSGALDHMVHPGFKSEGYVCMTEQLEFPSLVPVQPYQYKKMKN